MEKPVEWAKGLHHSNSGGFLSIITHFLLPDDHDNAPWKSHPRMDTWGSTFSYYFKGERWACGKFFIILLPPPTSPWVSATLISSRLLWNLVLPESFCNLAPLEFFLLSFYSCLFTFLLLLRGFMVTLLEKQSLTFTRSNSIINMHSQCDTVSTYSSYHISKFMGCSIL